MEANEGNGIVTNGRGKGLVAGGLIIAGGLLGAALGILYAPKSGKETREDLRHGAEDLACKAKEQYRKIGQLADEKKKSLVGETEKFKKAFEAGREAFKQGKTDAVQH